MLGSAILNALTLGNNRFKVKAKLRRYDWASIQPGGIPREYSGTAMEKLLGFLVAVVILAVYPGFFNLDVLFAGLAFFQDIPLALNLSFLAAMPLIYNARYRCLNCPLLQSASHLQLKQRADAARAVDSFGTDFVPVMPAQEWRA